MSSRRTAIVHGTLAVAALWLAATPGRGADAANPAPATVLNRVSEEQLTTIHLTPEAEARLGLEVATVEQRSLPRTRRLGGEVILPPRLNASAQRGSEQTVAAILPSLAPTELIRIAEAQIDADGQVERVRAELDATRIALQRAERLLGDKAGAQRTVDEARTQVAIAEAALRTAQARRALLGPPVLATHPPAALWVRVPVYAGDLATVRVQEDADVLRLSNIADTAGRRAAAVTGPPSANPAAASVDLFYALANDDGAFRLGEKVAVRLALAGTDDARVVPWAAVVHDAGGGAWVYERLAPQTYARRRIQIAGVSGDLAVLASGPPVGAIVVTNGAAELFGTEFGAGH